jgi:hypothetical protein
VKKLIGTIRVFRADTSMDTRDNNPKKFRKLKADWARYEKFIRYWYSSEKL